MSLRGFSIKPVLRPPYVMDGEETKEGIGKLLTEVLG